jgi:hypothetical protein
MPLLGIHSIEGRNGANDDAGLRIGGLLGGRLGSMFSINGQLTLDAVNAKNLAPGETFSSFKLSLTASPLFHVHQGRAEMVLGPKLGLFGFASTETLPSSGTGSGHGSGYVIGVNAGAFVALGRRLSLGGLLSYESQIYHQSCFTPPGTAESCSGNVGPANPVVGITAALLF